MFSSFNIKISKALLLGVLVAASISYGNEVPDYVKRFAPQVLISPYEKHLPTSVEGFIGASVLQKYDENNEVVLVNQNPSADDLVGLDRNHFLDVSNSKYGGLPAGKDGITAPAYARVTEVDGETEILYAFLYAYNGCQMFRGGFKYGDKPRNFNWCFFAQHEGDWEFIFVRLNAEKTAVKHVTFWGHGDAHTYPASEIKFTESGRPIVLSALHSHASYPYPSKKELDNVTLKNLSTEITVATLGRINKLKLIDHLKQFDNAIRLDDTVSEINLENNHWNTWNHLVMIDEDTTPWLRFEGRWGGPLNRNIGMPPPLPDSGDFTLFSNAVGLALFGVPEIKELTQPSNGINGLNKQSWWGGYKPEFDSKHSVVKSIDFGLDNNDRFMRVKLNEMKADYSCGNKDRYLLDSEAKNFKLLYQMLLAAKANKQKVKMKLKGCEYLFDKYYPVINSVDM